MYRNWPSTSDVNWRLRASLICVGWTVAVILAQKNAKKPNAIFFVDFMTAKWSQQGFSLSHNFPIRLTYTIIWFLYAIRYHELLEIHGHVAPFAEVKLAPPKVANVWVRFGEQRWNEKSLSLYMTMKELRGNTFRYSLVFFAFLISVELFQKNSASQSVFPRQNCGSGTLISIPCLCVFLQKDCTVTTWKMATKSWSMRNYVDFYSLFCRST